VKPKRCLSARVPCETRTQIEYLMKTRNYAESSSSWMRRSAVTNSAHAISSGHQKMWLRFLESSNERLGAENDLRSHCESKLQLSWKTLLGLLSTYNRQPPPKHKQKSHLGQFWRSLCRLENVDIFYAHLEYFTDIWYILW
jgi:hypothetical protein